MHKVDIKFKVSGKSLPVDHCYSLFAAISRELPELHHDPTIGILPLNGKLIGERMLALTNDSALTIRANADRVGEIIGLAGNELTVEGNAVHVGAAKIEPLIPRAKLYSRLVVVKGFTEEEPFLEAVDRQLKKMDIRGVPSLVERPVADPDTQGRSIRRTTRIRDKQIVGFALRVTGLTADESIRLQEHGLGGRRHFGCGIFIPDFK